ncbi:MAG: hypothetical protein EON58_17340 [Alphaproteobacteria bacterium]|nr:MAG: hypothetical protein EON58_17340 [Alphaproteobacteria bacterium]
MVDIRGVHVIEGTSDFIQSDEQQRLQTIATRYAERYNRLLFAYLMRTNDPSVSEARQKINQELLILERGDPIRDAKKAVRESPPWLFIELAFDSVPGIDIKILQADDSARIGYQGGPFAFVPEVMTPSQRNRLAQQVSRYIVPYNKYVFAAYQARKKAGKPVPALRNR